MFELKGMEDDASEGSTPDGLAQDGPVLMEHYGERVWVFVESVDPPVVSDGRQTIGDLDITADQAVEALSRCDGVTVEDGKIVGSSKKAVASAILTLRSRHPLIQHAEDIVFGCYTCLSIFGPDGVSWHGRDAECPECVNKTVVLGRSDRVTVDALSRLQADLL